MPTLAALATEPTPRTMVQKMIGLIIILMSPMKASASGCSFTAKSGKRNPTSDAEDHGDDDADVEPVGAVALLAVGGGRPAGLGGVGLGRGHDNLRGTPRPP